MKSDGRAAKFGYCALRAFYKEYKGKIFRDSWKWPFQRTIDRTCHLQPAKGPAKGKEGKNYGPRSYIYAGKGDFDLIWSDIRTFRGIGYPTFALSSLLR